MCGIAGVVGSDLKLDSTVRCMCDAMRHRGPDDSGYFNAVGVHLGMRRLSIMDVEHGAQPVSGESGQVAAVFNGEIYNYRELQTLLRSRGHHLATDSDSEVIPHLYEEFGLNFVNHLRGMFAIAIWDSAARKLILTRDRAGKKPLYYAEVNGTLWFASEMKGLLVAPEIDREIDRQALLEYLSFGYVSAPRSIYRGVNKLQPAHQLVWSGGQTRIQRYWDLQYNHQDDSRSLDEDEVASEFRAHLLDATRVRMSSERPLGAFLSGGLDSSAVVAAMSRVSSRPVKTYSIGFGEKSYSELPYAKRVAEMFGTDHHELVVTPDVHALLPRLARQFDEPYADSSAIPSFYLAEMAREGVVVALNGDGGDESFGGYTTYRHFMRVPPNLRVPRFLVVGANRSSEWIATSNIGASRLRDRVARANRLIAREPWERYGRLTSTWVPEELRRILRPDLAGDLDKTSLYRGREEIWKANLGTDPLNRLLAIDVDTYLPGDLLPKVDITTMAVSLEARSPFLDHRFMEWSASLPGTLKLRGSTTKYLMKSALRPWLPDDLIHRKKKGFSVPVAAWLAGPLKEMVEDLLFTRTGFVNNFVDLELVEADYRAGGSRGIYTLLMLELWGREVHGHGGQEP